MCILLKLDYAKFGVSNSFFFKSYRRKTFGGSGSLIKEGLVKVSQSNDRNLKIMSLVVN